MKRKMMFVMAALCIALSGCSDIKPDSPDSGEYATQNRLTAVEYSLYIGKQITVFSNQISARMGSVGNLSKGYSVDNEIALAKSSLEVLQETYDETYTIYPSEGSDDNRETTLLVMETAKKHLENYITDLEAGADVSGYFKDFENDFNALTGQAGLYNQ